MKPRVRVEPHMHAHTPVLLQFVVDFSGSDPATQTDRRLREEGLIRWPSCPHSPNASGFLSPDFIKAVMGDVGLVLWCIHPPGEHMYVRFTSPLPFMPPLYLRRQKNSGDSAK